MKVNQVSSSANLKTTLRNKAMPEEVTPLQKDILKVISTRFPHPYSTAEYIFLETKSFDQTIAILEVCSRSGLINSPLEALLEELRSKK